MIVSRYPRKPIKGQNGIVEPCSPAHSWRSAPGAHQVESDTIHRSLSDDSHSLSRADSCMKQGVIGAPRSCETLFVVQSTCTRAMQVVNRGVDLQK